MRVGSRKAARRLGSAVRLSQAAHHTPEPGDAPLPTPNLFSLLASSPAAPPPPSVSSCLTNQVKPAIHAYKHSPPCKKSPPPPPQAPRRPSLLFPLPLLPSIPRPLSRSRRIMQRFKRKWYRSNAVNNKTFVHLTPRPSHQTPADPGPYFTHWPK